MKAYRWMAGLVAAFAAMVLLAGIRPAGAQQGCVTDRYGKMQCGPADSRCVKDAFDEVRCSTPGGGIVLNRFREPVCGPGDCVINAVGEALCSSSQRGAAAVDRNGDAVCTDGCVKATAAACISPKK